MMTKKKKASWLLMKTMDFSETNIFPPGLHTRPSHWSLVTGPYCISKLQIPSIGLLTMPDWRKSSALFKNTVVNVKWLQLQGELTHNLRWAMRRLHTISHSTFPWFLHVLNVTSMRSVVHVVHRWTGCFPKLQCIGDCLLLIRSFFAVSVGEWWFLRVLGR
jgi:hypothetical protein